MLINIGIPSVVSDDGDDANDQRQSTVGKDSTWVVRIRIEIKDVPEFWQRQASVVQK